MSVTLMTETNLYKDDAIADGLDDASKVATNYLAYNAQNGLTVGRTGQSERAVITSDGMEIYDGQNENIAEFKAVTRLGEAGKANLQLDYHSMQLQDTDGNTYVYISDLRDNTGYATITEEHTNTTEEAGEYYVTLYHKLEATSDILSAKRNGVDLDRCWRVSDYQVGIGTALFIGDTATITYKTHDVIRAYTFGTRAGGAIGDNSFTSGKDLVASKSYSHAEGNNNTASGVGSHAEGSGNTAKGDYSHAEGNGNTANGHYSHVEGNGCIAWDEYCHAEGRESVSGLDKTQYPHTKAQYAHAEGYKSVASATYAHAEGDTCTAGGWSAHAEGTECEATGNFSHAEGYYSTANKPSTHAEGYYTEASGNYAHAEGANSTASGEASHAEGERGEASALCTHVGGADCTASGKYSFARGAHCTASGEASHAEGEYCQATATCSHASGAGTVANCQCQTTIGQYSTGNNSVQYLFTVGGGTSSVSKDVLNLDISGNLTITGTLTQSSDKRLKLHHAYLSDQEQDVNSFIESLKPAYFEKDQAKHLGFYAQDVQLSDKWSTMVSEDTNGYLALGYTEIIAPLVAYVQNQQKKIDSLEERIARLEQLINQQ